MNNWKINIYIHPIWFILNIHHIESSIYDHYISFDLKTNSQNRSRAQKNGPFLKVASKKPTNRNVLTNRREEQNAKRLEEVSRLDTEALGLRIAQKGRLEQQKSPGKHRVP